MNAVRQPLHFRAEKLEPMRQECLHFHVKTIHSGHQANMEKVKEKRMLKLEKLKANYMRKVDDAA